MSEYDRRAEAWVRAKYPGANPDPGSVKFTADSAAYASGGWSHMDVEWTERRYPKGEEIKDEAWQFDWSQIIRELLEIDPETGQSGH